MTPKSVLVIGSGFGLYGYIPALKKSGFKVYTLERYFEKIESRRDLNNIKSDLVYVTTENAYNNRYDAIVVARNPKSQMQYVLNNLCFKGHFFLEKPLAPDFESTQLLIKTMKKNQTRYSVAYLFKLTSWFQDLKQKLFDDSEIKILVSWKIQKPKSEWKLKTDKGGGLVNYYFIHFLPLILNLNQHFKIKIQSRSYDEKFICQIEFLNKVLKIQLEYDEQNVFKIIFNHPHIMNISLQSPFGRFIDSNLPDPRIDLLSSYIQQNLNKYDSVAHYVIEESILNLRQHFHSNNLKSDLY